MAEAEALRVCIKGDCQQRYPSVTVLGRSTGMSKHRRRLAYCV